MTPMSQSMTQLPTISPDPRSDLVNFPPETRNVVPKAGSTGSPQAGESTVAQTSAGGIPGSSAGGLPGFFTAASGTYSTYRQISAHPTNALVRGIVSAPI